MSDEIKNNDELVTEVQTKIEEEVGSEEVGTGEVETQEDNSELPRE